MTGSRYEYLTLTQDLDHPNQYTYDGNLSELVDDNNLSCKGYVRYNGKDHPSETVTYNASNELQINITIKPKPEYPYVTPDWEWAKIFCFDDKERITYYDNGKRSYSYDDDYDPKPVGYVYRDKDKYGNDYCDIVTLFANGGGVENLVGTKDNYKTKQLTLWEHFSGYEKGTYDSTKSKQITWIVTKDDVCPTNMKQKSDPSVVKVNKGKITAVAPSEGYAYVWACRADPNNKNLVSVGESARVKVKVLDAPAKVILTEVNTLQSTSDVTIPPIKKLDLGIGETKPIYIHAESKVEVLDGSKWKIEVTKGKEYLSVSSTGNEGTFTDSLAKYLKQNDNSFHVKADNMKIDSPKTAAAITVTNLFTGKKYKLNVNIHNCVVDTEQPRRGAGQFDEGVLEKIVSQPVRQTIVVPYNEINKYVETSAEYNFTMTNPDDPTGPKLIKPGYKKYSYFIDALTTDKPKVIVTATEDVTESMIFTDTPSGLKISNDWERSKTVTASWQSGGYLRVDIKAKAAAEKGNIILVFNKSHGVDGCLIIPYQITSDEVAPNS